MERRSVTATVWIDLETLRRIEELVRQGKFKSKSEFFRKAVEEFLTRLEKGAPLCPNCNTPLVVLEKPAEMLPSPDLLDLVPEDRHGEIPVPLITAVCPKCGFVAGLEIPLSEWQEKEGGEHGG